MFHFKQCFLFSLALLLNYTALYAQRHAGKVQGFQLQLHNLIPPFEEYLKTSNSLTGERKIELFKQKLLTSDTAFYKEVIQPKDSAFFAWYVPLVEDSLSRKILELHQHFPGYYSDALEQIAKTFPAIRKMNNNVYTCLSLFSSNGQVRKMRQGYVVYFGLDIQAFISSDVSDLKPLIEHELFHLLQSRYNERVYSKVDGSFDSRQSEPLYYHLFSEGLATYFPKHLNPDMPVAKVLFDTTMEASAKPNLKHLLTEMLKLIDSRERNDLRDFFWGNGKRTDIPKRSGYYLGYLLAEHLLNQGYSYQQLLVMKEERVRGVCIKALNELIERL